MVKVLFRLIIMAAPVICFWWLLQHVVIRLFHTGDVYLALGYVLGGVLLLGIWETLAVRVWVLPFFGRVFSSAVYGGGAGQNDPLADLAARIRAGRDSVLLQELVVLVHQDKARARAWSELSAIYDEVFHNRPEALHALMQGAEYAATAEERAMFLYRAARFRLNRMNDTHGARELFTRTASLYPNTAYGRKASRMVD